jgi:hypothetical protein
MIYSHVVLKIVRQLLNQSECQSYICLMNLLNNKSHVIADATLFLSVFLRLQVNKIHNSGFI